MFKTIIIGIDGREGGRDALELAQKLSDDASTLVLVEAYPVSSLPWRGAVGYFEALRKECVGTLESTRRDAEVDAEVVAVPDASFARALHHVAEDRDADLIVLGSAHHGRLGRLMLGDVGRGVVLAAPCAVAVAPKGYAAGSPDEIRRVAVGFDGASEAQAALELAGGWAAVHHAALTVHTAWDLSAVTTSSMVYAVDVETLANDAERWARHAAKRASGIFPDAEIRVARGAVDRVLEAAAEHADLMVVGSRGWGPVLRVGLGSTSDHLVHHSACPVIVVPRPLAQRAETVDGARETTAGSSGT